METPTYKNSRKDAQKLAEDALVILSHGAPPNYELIRAMTLTSIALSLAFPDRGDA